jgi:hypothetical protein
MRIALTDQTSTPTCIRAFRAELFDAHGIPCGVGYGNSEAEAIGDAWECLLDSLECEARLALAAAL